MNYNHLHYFYMVVRHGNISAASRELGVSQPSLSSQIKTFEESLGVALFDRRGNRLELTPAGRKVYENAAQMFELAATISSYVKSNSSQKLPIHLGIADEIERPFAVNLVRHLTKKWKKGEPPSTSFITGTSDELIGKLRSWSVDAVITNRPSSFNDLEPAGTMVLPIFFAISGRSDFNIQNAVECQPREVFKILKGLKRGLSVPSSRLKLREEIDSFLSKDSGGHAITFESDHLATMIRAIIDDIGVGFAPLPYMSREVAKGELIIFGPKEGLWTHTLFLMIKKGRGEAPGVFEISQAFADLRAEIGATSKKIQVDGDLDKFFEQLKEK
jgi:DNA-binding transcriptional LysR family regulator